MSNELATLNLSDDMKALFAGVMAKTGEDKEVIGGGESEAVPTLSMRGKVFRIKQGDEETDLGDTCKVIIVGHYPHKPRGVYGKSAKAFFNQPYRSADKYKEGERRPLSPSCYSYDGFTPIGGRELVVGSNEIINLDPVSASCEGCENNVWHGNTPPACRNEYRLAVVRYDDAVRGSWAPLLFVVPPTSIKLYNAFRKLLQDNVAPLAGIVVTLSFDAKTEHPKPRFDRFAPIDSPALLAQAMSAGQQNAAREMVGLPLVEGAQDMTGPVTVEGESRQIAPGDTVSAAEMEDPEPEPDAPAAKPSPPAMSDEDALAQLAALAKGE